MAADMRVAAGSPYDAETLVQEWMSSVGQGVPGYQTPKVAVGAVVGDDEGRDPAGAAVGLGGVALPDRVGRHRATRPPRWR